MDLFGDMQEEPELQGFVGLALIVGAGLSLGALAVNHAIQTQVASVELVYIATPLIVNAGLVATGTLLWARFDGPEMLRVGGWVFVGMVVFGLLVTWTVTHEVVRGDAVTHSLFLTTTTISIGGFVGLILGWFDARNRLYEKQLEREHEKLERRIEQLDEFASIVSHDLRNPLNVASLHVETLKAEREGESVEKIDDSLNRMERIIEDVLTMAKEGRTVEETRRVSLSEVAAHCWGNVETNGANFDVADELQFQADRSQLEHILENLFRNAIEHGMPEGMADGTPSEGLWAKQGAIEDGGTDFTVRVGALPDGFFVEDTGNGIPEVAEDSLFESGVTTNEDGTGFGLRIVDKMATAHGWEVTAGESEKGGARFEITGVQIGSDETTE